MRCCLEAQTEDNRPPPFPGKNKPNHLRHRLLSARLEEQRIMGARPSTLFSLPVKSFMPTLMLRLKDQLVARRQSVRGKRTKLRQFWRKPATVNPPPLKTVGFDGTWPTEGNYNPSPRMSSGAETFTRQEAFSNNVLGLWSVKDAGRLNLNLEVRGHLYHDSN